MDSFPPLMGSCGAILGIIEQSTRSQNAAHFNKNGAVWSHFVTCVTFFSSDNPDGRSINGWFFAKRKVQTERKGSPKTLAFH